MIEDLINKFVDVHSSDEYPRFNKMMKSTNVMAEIKQTFSSSLVRERVFTSIGFGGAVFPANLRFILSGEFDPGSERTLAACLTHASRTRKFLRKRVKWRTGE